MSRQHFTPGEHVAAGAALRRIRHELQSLAISYGRGYGPGKAEKLLRVVSLLDLLRSGMDEVAACEAAACGGKAVDSSPYFSALPSIASCSDGHVVGFPLGGLLAPGRRRASGFREPSGP